HGSHIVIGEGARVTGGIVSEEVVVRGTVEGSIRGRKVMLQAESKVEGDIYHKSLAIEQGAYFEGKSRRLEDPLAGVQRPELPAEPAPAYDRAPSTNWRYGRLGAPPNPGRTGPSTGQRSAASRQAARRSWSGM